MIVTVVILIVIIIAIAPAVRNDRDDYGDGRGTQIGGGERIPCFNYFVYTQSVMSFHS